MSITITTGGTKYGGIGDLHAEVSIFHIVRRDCSIFRSPNRFKGMRSTCGLQEKLQDVYRRCATTQRWISSMIKRVHSSTSELTNIVIYDTSGWQTCVAIAEILGRQLRESGVDVTIIHRDVHRQGKKLKSEEKS